MGHTNTHRLSFICYPSACDVVEKREEGKVHAIVPDRYISDGEETFFVYLYIDCVSWDILCVFVSVCVSVCVSMFSM